VPRSLSVVSLERQMVDFLESRSDGAALMLEIDGDGDGEPQLPSRLAALLECRCAVAAPRAATAPRT
jgi:hypothetical protein